MDIINRSTRSDIEIIVVCLFAVGISLFFISVLGLVLTRWLCFFIICITAYCLIREINLRFKARTIELARIQFESEIIERGGYRYINTRHIEVLKSDTTFPKSEPTKPLTELTEPTEPELTPESDEPVQEPVSGNRIVLRESRGDRFETDQERIIRLYQSGESLTAIARAVYGTKNGKTFRKVKDALGIE